MVNLLLTKGREMVLPPLPKERASESMDAEDNGLALEGLAQRLETLERENTELQSKVATLEGSAARRDALVEKRGSDTPRSEEAASEFVGQVSRRALLSKAGAAAVAAVAAGTLLNAREAKATEFLDADVIRAHKVLASSDTPGEAIFGEQQVSGGNGVTGHGRGPDNAGVRGFNFDGAGVIAQGMNGVVGVVAHDNSPLPATTVGNGVVGEGEGPAGAGVLGRNSTGYGGQFEGGRAQLKFVPGSTAGKPTTGAHSKGEIYMDSAVTLFVCTAGGTPGTWARINATLVPR
jgi:hypothetical protein